MYFIDLGSKINIVTIVLLILCSYTRARGGACGGVPARICSSVLSGVCSAGVLAGVCSAGVLAGVCSAYGVGGGGSASARLSDGLARFCI